MPFVSPARSAAQRTPATTRPHVVFLAASLRRASLNARLLRAVQLLAPPHWSIEEDRSFAALPLYDQDLDTAMAPSGVTTWRETVARADAFVICTPEYNHALPSALKNAIDWASSPPGNATLSGKVVACLVATSGATLGRGAWTQAHSVLAALGNYVVPAPQVVVHRAQDKVGVTGVEGDDGTTRFDVVRAQAAEVDRAWKCAISRRLATALIVATDHALEIGAGAAARVGLDWLAQDPPID